MFRRFEKVSLELRVALQKEWYCRCGFGFAAQCIVEKYGATKKFTTDWSRSFGYAQDDRLLWAGIKECSGSK